MDGISVETDNNKAADAETETETDEIRDVQQPDETNPYKTNIVDADTNIVAELPKPQIDPVILNERDVKGYDFLLKFIVVGNSCVGKSNIALRFTRDRFDQSNESTIGAEYSSKLMCYDSKVYKIQIWDTAGQDTFKTITRSYYRNSIGCIIAFDVTNRESFNAIRTWYAELIERSEPYTGKQTIVLVGNKTDIADRSISIEEASDLAAELKIHYYEASAKTGHNVRHIFNEMVKDIDTKINNQELKLKIGTGGTIVLGTESDLSSGYSYLPAFCAC